MPNVQDRLVGNLTASPAVPYVQRRKAIVVTTTPLGCTIILGDSGVSVPRVKWATDTIPVEGDLVWVDFLGPDPIIIAKAASQAGPREAAINMTLIGSYTNFGAPYEVARYWRDSDGFVHLEGLVARASFSGGTSMFTLPVGYRPIGDRYFSVIVANNTTGRIRVAGDGNIYHDNARAGAVAPTFISLSGIIFQATEYYSPTQWKPYARHLNGSPSNAFGVQVGVYERDDGYVMAQGVWANYSAPAVALMHLLPEHVQRWTELWHPSNGNGANEVTARVDRDLTGTLVFQVGSTASSALVLDGINWWSHAMEDAWITPTMGNSWVQFATTGPNQGYQTLQYMIDKHSVVHMRGLIKNGTIGATIFTLPAGYRPANKQIFVGIGAGDAARIDIDNAGVVQVAAGSNSYVSFAQVMFRAEL